MTTPPPPTPPPASPSPGSAVSPPVSNPDTVVLPITPPAPIIPIITPTLTYSQKVLIAVGISAAAILLAILVYYIAEILVLCFAGLLMAVFVSAPSDILAKHTKLKRAHALLIVLTTLAIIVVGGGYFMGRTIYEQSKQIVHDSRRTLREYERLLPKPAPATAPASAPATEPAPDPATPTDVTVTTDGDTTSILVRVHSPEAAATQPTSDDPAQWIANRLEHFRETATDFLFNENVVRRAGGFAGSFITSTFGIIGNVVIVFGVGLFFALNPSLYTQGLIRMVPVKRRARTANILSQVGSQLEWWFVGQLCSMASIGLLTTIGLKILGMPMALTLGILAGLMNFIPNFGPILAAAPAVLIALAPHEGQTQINPALAGWVVLLYIVIQLLEGWVITPFFQQRAVELPPALIIISQVIFGLLLGPLGLVLATPILATLIVLVRLLYVEDILGDKPPEPIPPSAV
jgi:predicted PurR-regulated permease PerM